MPECPVWLCLDLRWYGYEILYNHENAEKPARGNVEENRHDLDVQ